VSVKKLRRLAVTAVVWMLILAASLTSATYAWFTSNTRVSTSRATARTSSDAVTLEISAAGGENFRAVDAAPITQVNRTDAQNLMPVSTADLRTFFRCTLLDGSRTSYQVVTEERDYYHGVVYLRAVVEGQSTGGRLALYLDESASGGGVLASASDGYLLNAARLGLTFNGGNGKIFYLSARQNAASDQVRNTYLNGALVRDGMVLGGTAGNILAVNDPAAPLSAYTISTENGALRLPNEPLLYMELNTIYAVDVYFYLEGCDPDCSDAVSFDAADLHLAFYGILE